MSHATLEISQAHAAADEETGSLLQMSQLHRGAYCGSGRLLSYEGKTCGEETLLLCEEATLLSCDEDTSMFCGRVTFPSEKKTYNLKRGFTLRWCEYIIIK